MQFLQMKKKADKASKITRIRSCIASLESKNHLLYMFIYGLILYDGGVNVKVNAYFICD